MAVRRLIIAVDCDEVLVTTAPAILSWYNASFGTSIDDKDFYNHDLALWGVDTADEAIARVNGYLRSDAYRSLPPDPAAVTALRQLRRHHELHMITGRADFLEGFTRQWTSEHFPDLFTSMELTNYIVPSSHAHVTRSKADVCRQIGADVLIDDHLHHAEAVAATGVRVLLFGDYPWNRTAGVLPLGIKRAKDWPAVLAALE